MHSRHSTYWSHDRWYSRAWIVGPQAIALLLAGWLLAGPSLHSEMRQSAWGTPMTFEQLDDEMRLLRDKATVDSSSLEKLIQLARHGQPIANFYVGTLYDPYVSQVAWPKDVMRAMKYYEQAAEKELPAAEHNLAYMLMAGTWNPIDLKRGCEWATRAAEHGWMGGQRLLGFCYRDGSMGLIDKARAFEWFMRAAQQGDVIAQAEVMSAYARGDGVGKDEVFALEWGRKAADSGNVFAQAYLGEAYLYGKGTSKNGQLAKTYLTQAASKGSARAQALLVSIPEDAAD